MWSGTWSVGVRPLRSAQWIPHNKAFVTREESLFLVVPALQGECRVAVASGSEEAIHTPQCFVQMELTRDLERGLKNRNVFICEIKSRTAWHTTLCVGVSQKQ